jgi:DNA-binding NarL/FixJ family response regulator
LQWQRLLIAEFDQARRTMARYEIRLVSDDPLVRQIFSDEIEESGHLVASVGSAQLGALRGDKAEPVDLILIDQALLGTMEEADLKRLEAAWPRAHIALLADSGAEADQRHFEDQFAVIAKETRTAERLKAIEAAARGESMTLPSNAATSRMDLFFQKIVTRPAVAGIQRELQTVYDAPPTDMPGAFADLLGKLPPSVT